MHESLVDIFRTWDIDEMSKIFSRELEAKEQASLTVKKGYEKSRENYTIGALYSTLKLSSYQVSSCNLTPGSRSSNKSCFFV